MVKVAAAVQKTQRFASPKVMNLELHTNESVATLVLASRWLVLAEKAVAADLAVAMESWKGILRW